MTPLRSCEETFRLFRPVWLEFLGIVAAETNEPQSKFLRFKEAAAVIFGLSKFTPKLQRRVVVFHVTAARLILTRDRTWTPKTF